MNCYNHHQRCFNSTLTPFFGLRMISTTAGLDWNVLKQILLFEFHYHCRNLELSSRKCLMIHEIIIFSSYIAKRCPDFLNYFSPISCEYYRYSFSVQPKRESSHTDDVLLLYQEGNYQDRTRADSHKDF